MQLDAIVPAHNEAPTIAAVVQALRASPSVSRVLVVNDGSTDETSAVARLAGAEVLDLSPNQGKGRAMLAGLQQSTSAFVGFFDSDLIGLRPDHIETMAAASRLGFDMVCGLRDYGIIGNPAQLLGPLITGERIITRALLQQIPTTCWSGYAIETAMNDAARRTGARTGCVLLSGLTIRNKVSKGGGFWKGMLGHVKMFSEISRTRQALEGTCGRACSSQ